MSNPFIGEIRMVAFNFAPKGWAMCNGQLLSIQQNQALFSLLGTMYGGNGVQNFGLPNFEGRSPLHFGNGPGGSYIQGETGGSPTVTIFSNTMAAHVHSLQAASRPGTATTPAGNVVAAHRGGYANPSDGPNAVLASQSVTNVGGGQPHNNMAPYLVINFAIALIGIFPSRN